MSTWLCWDELELALHLLSCICSVLSQLTLWLSKVSTLHRLLLASFIFQKSCLIFLTLCSPCPWSSLSLLSHHMLWIKGILIGFYYVIRYGVGGIFELVQELICSHVDIHTTSLSINCSMLSNIVITIIAVVSFIMYCVVACKYKLRERDEVVNVHIFAEEYYGTRENNFDIVQNEWFIRAQ